MQRERFVELEIRREQIHIDMNIEKDGDTYNDRDTNSNRLIDSATQIYKNTSNTL